MKQSAHDYAAHLVWEGGGTEGTADYRSYGRAYRVRIAGKPDLAGTADPAFRGEADKHNPEDLFLAAISACHMLSYLALCALQGVRVLAYEDEARGRMVTDAGGGGRFEEVVLHPTVTLTDEASVTLAAELHDRAHRICFIANSCSVPIRHQVTLRTEPAANAAERSS